MPGPRGRPRSSTAGSGRPASRDVWSKLQLGWLDFDRAEAGEHKLSRLGPVEYNNRLPQALVVDLPKKTVTTWINAPFAGANEWWSGSNDNLDVTLTRDLDLTGKTSAELTAKAWYDLETDYDYAYLEVSADNGATWTAVPGAFNGTALPDNAINGSSRGNWGDLAFSLDAFAGKNVKVRFHNTTDGGVHMKGLALDDITITVDGAAVLTDGAENGDNGWTAAGFSRITGTFSKDYDQKYLVENRQYVSFDTTLKTGPYNFGFRNTRPDWVEHYANQNGLLIWLWDSSQTDNDVANHPGAGLILPVDAHPAPLKWSDGSLMQPRLQGYDGDLRLRGHRRPEPAQGRRRHYRQGRKECDRLQRPHQQVLGRVQQVQQSDRPRHPHPDRGPLEQPEQAGDPGPRQAREVIPAPTDVTAPGGAARRGPCGGGSGVRCRQRRGPPPVRSGGGLPLLQRAVQLWMSAAVAVAGSWVGAPL
ncbi:immune inhibitor A peptidase M6 [Streptomyces sp. PanSC19]|nr:immune inhibitor A peptidase M6 [Streptomyces sp. PanSC19]